ncbi:hypothetical protein PDJAM_G00072040, partial [Pangasius djambal]|nr:hypothetical protein [Pangasius djambal]
GSWANSVALPVPVCFWFSLLQDAALRVSQSTEIVATGVHLLYSFEKKTRRVTKQEVRTSLPTFSRLTAGAKSPGETWLLPAVDVTVFTRLIEYLAPQ